ncbi:MAG TPA: 8-oxo-dGTP diphosphatase [Candidatus Saccharimonadales bacterium]|nr:8-oxo-dGTP diphosphatase [Candidatus Saccharimonadales bacterium]
MKQVTILFLLRGDEVLLAMKKRGFGAGKWNGVGGKTDEGETIEHAAIRECQEEIGVTPRQLQRVGDIQFYDKSDPSFGHHAHVFTTTEWDGEPVETEEMRPQWFKTDAIPYNEMWAADSLWMPRVLRAEPFEGTITFDGETLVSHTIKPIPAPSREGT